MKHKAIAYFSLTNINIAYLYAMKKILILVSVILSLAALANGQEAKTLLWKVSGNGLAKPSYLFGTIHLICPSDYMWTEKMQQSFVACNKVCFEMDLDDEETMTAASVGFIDPSGKKLKDHFKPADYQRLQKFMKDSIGMDMFMLQAMKPIALESIISMKSVKCKDAMSYEETLMKKANEHKMEVIGLEPASEQINALDHMPADSVVISVMELVDSFAKSKREFNELMAAYKAQDLPLLYQKITGVGGVGDGIGVLLNDRNKRWIDRMAVKMKGNAVFFAVGAGHLAGKDGIIALLRHAGYTVEPVL